MPLGEPKSFEYLRAPNQAAALLVNGMPSVAVPLPAGVSMFPGEQMRLSRHWTERRFADLRVFAEAQRGGHFAAMEHLKAFIEHVRETFRTVR
ncbi:hypothetical protein [Aurantimonas sp. 22II-16-19i]|uniref:hypothetical protein n=1 Tax=Aurantimonas sp. 22II-16-19i TaxID=1317114 RepID=UPI0009F7D8BF|nr:hypothetical protein [Aurantimonas sp. 22II-16-19i]ORE93266.1 epoxide hydrolase [Aurantimonas sp. 22II-16-19i]